MSICNLRDELIVHELALVAITHLKAGKVGNICMRARARASAERESLLFRAKKRSNVTYSRFHAHDCPPSPHLHTRAAMKSSLLVNDDQPAQFL